jgi:hypothetical protein
VTEALGDIDLAVELGEVVEEAEGEAGTRQAQGSSARE